MVGATNVANETKEFEPPQSPTRSTRAAREPTDT
jgi:hypothetical protein